MFSQRSREILENHRTVLAIAELDRTLWMLVAIDRGCYIHRASTCDTARLTRRCRSESTTNCARAMRASNRL